MPYFIFTSRKPTFPLELLSALEADSSSICFSDDGKNVVVSWEDFISSVVPVFFPSMLHDVNKTTKDTFLKQMNNYGFVGTMSQTKFVINQFYFAFLLNCNFKCVHSRQFDSI